MYRLSHLHAISHMVSWISLVPLCLIVFTWLFAWLADFSQISFQLCATLGQCIIPHKNQLCVEVTAARLGDSFALEPRTHLLALSQPFASWHSSAVSFPTLASCLEYTHIPDMGKLNSTVVFPLIIQILLLCSLLTEDFTTDKILLDSYTVLGLVAGRGIPLPLWRSPWPEYAQRWSWHRCRTCAGQANIRCGRTRGCCRGWRAAVAGQMGWTVWQS